MPNSNIKYLSLPHSKNIMNKDHQVDHVWYMFFKNVAVQLQNLANDINQLTNVVNYL